MYGILIMILSVSVFANELTPNVDLDIIQKRVINTFCGVEVFLDRTDCFFIRADDDIAYMNPNITFKRSPIFFIDTSCGGGLNFKQACSVESAARAHPSREVNVLFIGPVSEICLAKYPMWELRKYTNVKIYRLDLMEFLENTPLSDFVSSGNFRRSIYPKQHTMDILRFATLNRYGGIFLDLDVIVTKSFDKLPVADNWVGRKSKYDLGSGVMAFSKRGIGQIISHEILRRLKVNYNPNAWQYAGMKTLLQILESVCNTKDINKMQSYSCEGFHVYPPEYFYPVKYQDYEVYYKKHDGHISSVPYAFYIWSDLALGQIIYNDSLYIRLMKQFCPRIHASFTKNKSYLRPPK